MTGRCVALCMTSRVDRLWSRLSLADRHFVIEPGRTAQHQPALTAELVDDGEDLVPGKLGKPRKQDIEGARALLEQL